MENKEVIRPTMKELGFQIGDIVECTLVDSPKMMISDYNENTGRITCTTWNSETQQFLNHTMNIFCIDGVIDKIKELKNKNKES